MRFSGSASAINGTFNHYSDTTRGDTNTLTEVKENISMWQMQAIIENNRYLTEDEISDLILGIKHGISLTNGTH